VLSEKVEKKLSFGANKTQDRKKTTSSIDKELAEEKQQERTRDNN